MNFLNCGLTNLCVSNHMKYVSFFNGEMFSYTQVYLVGDKFAFEFFLIYSCRSVSTRAKVNTLLHSSVKS